MSEDLNYDVTQDSDLAKTGAIRCISTIIMVAAIVMTIIMGLSGNGTAAGFFAVVACISCIVGCYFMFIKKDVDFFTYDFGDFTTEIHKVFTREFEEVPFDEDMDLPDCKITKFTNSVETGEKKYEHENRWVGNRHYEKYENIPTKCFFEVTCIEFKTPEECRENEKKIKNHDFKKGLSFVYTEHFSSGNIHIVFKCYSIGFSSYLNKSITFMEHGVALANNTYSPSSLAKRAAKKVKLK